GGDAGGRPDRRRGPAFRADREQRRVPATVVHIGRRRGRGGGGLMSTPTATDWRGVAAEDVENLDKVTTARLQARSRRLLGSLLRPHKWAVLLALVFVLLENGAQLAGPLLVAAAIDRGVT